MKKTNLSEFRKQAKDSASKFQKDNLKTGETGWISGFAEPSEDGIVSIRNENGIIISLFEKDVKEIREHDGKFYLRVSPGIQILTKIETVKQLNPIKSMSTSGCDCESKQEDNQILSKIRRPNFGGIRPSQVVITEDPCIVCHTELEERWCTLPGGEMVKCYVPVQVCENTCVLV